MKARIRGNKAPKLYCKVLIGYGLDIPSIVFGYPNNLVHVG